MGKKKELKALAGQLKRDLDAMTESHSNLVERIHAAILMTNDETHPAIDRMRRVLIGETVEPELEYIKREREAGRRFSADKDRCIMKIADIVMGPREVSGMLASGSIPGELPMAVQRKLDAVRLRLTQLAVYENAVEHGWWRDGDSMPIDPVPVIPEKLALIHSEVSEALEDYRDSKMETVVREDGKPEGFPSELADVIIRVLDLAEALGLDMEREIELKHEFNKTRSPRHGGKRC